MLVARILSGIRLPLAAAPASANKGRLSDGVMVPLLRWVAKVQPKTILRHQRAAQRFFEARNLEESMRRWRWVLAMQPSSVQALVGLGWALLEDQRPREASAMFLEALARRPTLQEARWLLARATLCRQSPDMLPHTTPLRMLQRDLPLLAPIYDQVRMISEGVVAPSEVVKRAIAHIPLERAGRLLDIGCGTGLVGEQLWPLGLHMEGVDAVPAMLQQAAKRTRLLKSQMDALEYEFAHGSPTGPYTPEQIIILRAQIPLAYNALWPEDARDYLLRQRIPAFDIITACDVFSEIGGLSPVFDGAQRTLLPGGVLVASTNPGPAAGYAPQGKDVRFAHSEAYLNDQAARVGFAVLSHEIAPFDAKRKARYSIFRKPA